MNERCLIICTLWRANRRSSNKDVVVNQRRCRIWCPHGGKSEDGWLPGCSAVYLFICFSSCDVLSLALATANVVRKLIRTEDMKISPGTISGLLRPRLTRRSCHASSGQARRRVPIIFSSVLKIFTFSGATKERTELWYIGIQHESCRFTKEHDFSPVLRYSSPGARKVLKLFSKRTTLGRNGKSSLG